jgi:hypothetical protein
MVGLIHTPLPDIEDLPTMQAIPQLARHSTLIFKNRGLDPVAQPPV